MMKRNRENVKGSALKWIKEIKGGNNKTQK